MVVGKGESGLMRMVFFRQEAQTFFGFDDEAIEAAVGNGFTFEGGDVDKFRAAIPANVALGVESCLQKCNIAKNK